MRIQLSKEKIIKDSVVVWNEAGPDVDLTMDLKALTFKSNSVDEIFSYHVLDHLFFKEAEQALRNWYDVLKPDADLMIVVDDFEYLARGFVGGDISIERWNESFTAPSYYSKETLVELLTKVGFKDGQTKVWYEIPPDLFAKKKYELILSAKKI